MLSFILFIFIYLFMLFIYLIHIYLFIYLLFIYLFIYLLFIYFFLTMWGMFLSFMFKITRKLKILSLNNPRGMLNALHAQKCQTIHLINFIVNVAIWCPKQQAENKHVFALGLTFFTKNAEKDFFFPTKSQSAHINA